MMFEQWDFVKEWAKNDSFSKSSEFGQPGGSFSNQMGQIYVFAECKLCPLIGIGSMHLQKLSGD